MPVARTPGLRMFDLDRVARRTPGYTALILPTCLNEAANSWRPASASPKVAIGMRSTDGHWRVNGWS